MTFQLRTFLGCVGLIVIAGCSGGFGAAPSAYHAMTPQHVRANTFGETFKLRVTVKTQACVRGSGTATFIAKGTASGPYKGTFSGTGTWNFYKVAGTAMWVFSEQFKIVGANIDGTITGNGNDGKTATCKTFAAIAKKGKLTYHLGKASGSAETTLLKNRANVTQHLI